MTLRWFSINYYKIYYSEDPTYLVTISNKTQGKDYSTVWITALSSPLLPNLNPRPPEVTSDLPLTQCYLLDNRLTANTPHAKPKRPDWKHELKIEITVDEYKVKFEGEREACLRISLDA